MYNYFNSSRASPELVPYIKMAKSVPIFRKRMVLPLHNLYLDISYLHLTVYTLGRSTVRRWFS